MNYSMLNKSEILRIAEPETPLEVKLFEIIDTDFSDSESMAGQIHDLEVEIEDMVPGEDHREAVDDLELDIDEKDKEIVLLKKLLDDNEIDYSDVA